MYSHSFYLLTFIQCFPQWSLLNYLLHFLISMLHYRFVEGFWCFIFEMKDLAGLFSETVWYFLYQTTNPVLMNLFNGYMNHWWLFLSQSCSCSWSRFVFLETWTGCFFYSLVDNFLYHCIIQNWFRQNHYHCHKYFKLLGF